MYFSLGILAEWKFAKKAGFLAMSCMMIYDVHLCIKTCGKLWAIFLTKIGRVGFALVSGLLSRVKAWLIYYALLYISH